MINLLQGPVQAAYRRTSKTWTGMDLPATSGYLGDLCLPLGFFHQVNLVEHHNHVITRNLTNHKALHAEHEANTTFAEIIIPL